VIDALAIEGLFLLCLTGDPTHNFTSRENSSASPLPNLDVLTSNGLMSFDCSTNRRLLLDFDRRSEVDDLLVSSISMLDEVWVESVFVAVTLDSTWSLWLIESRVPLVV